MIFLYDSQKYPVGSYRCFEEACDYFRRLEYFRDLSLSAPDTFHQERWDFVYHSHKSFPAPFGCLKESTFNELEQEGYWKDFDLIEVYAGGPIPQQIMVTPDIDVMSLMRDWCLDYCYANNFVLFETIRGGLECDEPREFVPINYDHQSFSCRDSLQGLRQMMPFEYDRACSSEYEGP